MKIYTKLVIDMATDEVLEQESFEYNGPVAQCGSSGGGGGSMPANTTNITTVREAPGIEERKLGLMDISRALAEQPVSIPTQQIAGLSGLEQQGQALSGQTGVGQTQLQSGIAGIGAGQQTIRSGLALGQAGVGAGVSSAFGGPDINRFFNPYQSFILDEINRQAQMGQQQLSAQAVQAGAFGGGREGIQQAEQERARLQQIGLAQERAFTGALGAAQQQQSLETQTGLQAGQILGSQGFQAGALEGQLGQALAGLGQQQQQMQQADINQLMAAGGLQRQLAQQTLDAQRAQQLQQAYEPFQRAEFLKSQYQGGPTSQSGITQTTAPTVNPLAQAAGAGLGAYAAYQTAQASRPVIQIGNQPTK